MEVFLLILLEILHSSLEQLDVVFAGDIFVQAVADTLAVTHLAQDSAVGRGDTLTLLYERVKEIHVKRFPYNDFLFQKYDVEE